MSFTKVDYKDQETVITAENMNDIQDAILALEDGLFTMEDDRSGEVITITDASNRGFRSLNIYGKTAQDGTPTPDAPVDLVSVGDDGTISTKVFGKNIIAPAMASGMLNGITITNNKDGSFTINGTATNNVSFRIDQSTANGTDKLKSYKGKFYISLRDSSGTINPQGLTLYLMQNETYKAILSSSTKPTADIETSKAFIYIEVPQGKTFSNLVVYPQLECGSTMTSWEMAREQSLDVTLAHNLNGIPVTSGGNYTDADGQQWICDEIDFARGVYVQRVGSKVLTGEETYMDYIASTGGVSTYLTHLDLTPFICSHFSMGQTAKWANAGAILFYVAAAGCTTMDGFVAFVAEQYTNGTPITVAYILATPIETPLSEEELAAYANLRTYKDNTTVSNDAGAWMDIEYVMDAKKYIDSLVGTGGSIIPATVE